MKAIGIVTYILLLLACTSRENKIIITELKPVDTVESVNQEFLKSVKDIRKTQDGFSFIDRYSQAAFVVDENFNLIKRFGERGKGPGEFIGLVSAFYHGNILRMIDTQAGKIVTYNFEQDNITETQVKDLKVFHTRIAQGPEIIYAQLLPAQKVIKKFNASFKLSASFGEGFPSEEPGEIFSRSHRHLLTQNDTLLYSVWLSEPIIKIYDNQGNLLRAYDYAKRGYFEGRLKFVHKKRDKDPNNRFKTYTLIEDANVYKNHLYLLHAGTDKNNGYTCNEVLIFESLSHKLRPVKKIILGGSQAYSSICAWEEGILAFDNVRGAFHFYKQNGAQ